MKIKLTPRRIYRLSPLALALFCCASYAAVYDSTVKESKPVDSYIQIGNTDNVFSIGVNSNQNKTIVINTTENGTIDIYSAAIGLNANNPSTPVSSSSQINIGSSRTDSLNIKTEFSAKTGSYRQYIAGVNVTQGAIACLDGKNININVDGKDQIEVRGIVAGSTNDGVSYGNSNVVIGSNATENLSVTVNGEDSSMGIFSLKAQTSLQARNITIDALNGDAVLVQNNTENATAPNNAASITIDADNTIINAANGAGLMAFSNGQLEVGGNLTVNAKTAIVARGYSTININQDNQGTVFLNGDISFETPGPGAQSGENLDAYVNINLVGEDSAWTGNVRRQYTHDQEEATTEVKHFNLLLAQGAQWNPSVINGEQDDIGVLESIAVNHVELNDGIINANHGAEQTVEIENLTGSGGQINLLATTDGDNVDSASVVIGTAAEDTHLTVAARGITADDISDVDAAMASLNEKVVVSNTSAATKQNVIAQGDVIGAITQDVNAAGETSVVRVAENTKLASFKAVNAAAVAAWRDEVAYTNQHLDFLRDNDHAYGVWAQVYGGESNFDDADMDLTSTTVQVGFDALLGGWVTGVAASYMEGDADMSNGSADIDGYTFALYTERRFDNGFFVNGIARYGRLSTDATADNMSASYDNDAFSIGANGGYRFTFAKYGFIEPSIGLQYAFVKGDDFTSSNHVKVEQDDYNALIGDIGARIGFNFADNMGKLYARAYLNHDFDGDLDGKAYNEKAVAAMESDLGGTWVTYGIGTQVNFTDNFTVFANFDRSSGNEVDTDYMLNAGLRYTF